MKILVFASTFPNSELDGSRPRFIYDLAEALGAHADVAALVPHHPGAPFRERMGSVDVRRFRYWWPASAEALTPNMRQRMQTSLLARMQVPFFFAAQLLGLARTVRDGSWDVVNAHWIIPQGLTAALVRSLPGFRFRLALHVHAGDVYMLARLPLGGAIARFVLRRCDRVFAAGSHVRDTLDELLGHPSDAILQPMGVDPDVFGEAGVTAPTEATRFEEGYLLFVGRFVEKKGAVYLVRAFEAIQSRHPGLGLILIGSGPEEKALRSEVRSLGLEHRALFVGHRSHADVVRFLRHCRVAAVPSIVDSRGETEGMPTVVAEAMMSGVPVVGSDVNGIPDLIRHGENGWLCREKDPAHLAEMLEAALDSLPNSSVVLKARETAEKLRWPRIGRTYAEALHG